MLNSIQMFSCRDGRSQLASLHCCQKNYIYSLFLANLNWGKSHPADSLALDNSHSSLFGPLGRIIAHSWCKTFKLL